jgi:hypothetical protein
MRRWASGLILAAVAPVAWAQSGVDAYRALGLKPQEVLSGTVTRANVFPGGEKQLVCLATYLTGKKDEANAVNVRLGVFDVRGADNELVPLYKRDLAAELGGHVGYGEIQILDLDLDHVSEIVLTYELFKDALIKERQAEIVLHDGKGLRTAWKGPIEYDATRAARSVPEDRRDHFVREFDWAKTMRTRGVTLFVSKRMLAIAGETLPAPQTVEETFPLRPAEGG